MAECIISRNRHLRLGATAGASLRQLRRSRNQMGDEIRIGPGSGGRGRIGLTGVRERNKGVAQRWRLLSRNGTWPGFPYASRKRHAAVIETFRIL